MASKTAGRNPARVRADQERRRSNAAGPHPDRRTRGSRSDRKRRAVAESTGTGRQH